jgi:uncharacterized tellurite resistance protein B-like protein
MRSEIYQLNSQKSTLENYIFGADGNWHDEVKQAFFSAHIVPIRQSYSIQNAAMEQVAKVIEEAEKEIKSLM